MNTRIQLEYQHLVSAWRTATSIKGVDANITRVDRRGHIVCWPDFQNQRSPYGWTVIDVGPAGCHVLRGYFVAVNIHHNDNEVEL